MNVRKKLQISWNYECCETLQINTVDIIIKSMIYFYAFNLLNMTFFFNLVEFYDIHPKPN